MFTSLLIAENIENIFVKQVLLETFFDKNACCLIFRKCFCKLETIVGLAINHILKNINQTWRSEILCWFHEMIVGKRSIIEHLNIYSHRRTRMNHKIVDWDENSEKKEDLGLCSNQNYVDWTDRIFFNYN